MTDHRFPKADGHAVGKGKDQSRTLPDEQPTGAFDLLAAQIEALRNEIDYLKEQVALLQETTRRERPTTRRQQNQTQRESSI
jgi:hypothetical protein